MKREDLKEFFSRYVYPFSGGSGHLTGNIDPEVIEDGSNECVKIAEQYADQFKPKWISVKDQLPKHINLCLIFKEKSIGLASYSPKDNYWILFRNGKAVEYTDITHWMNLPEPPCK